MYYGYFGLQGAARYYFFKQHKSTCIEVYFVYIVYSKCISSRKECVHAWCSLIHHPLYSHAMPRIPGISFQIHLDLDLEKAVKGAVRKIRSKEVGLTFE